MKIYIYLLNILVVACTFACVSACLRKASKDSIIVKVDNSDSVVSLKGRVVSYNTDKLGCFFTDPEMIVQGISSNLGDKVDSTLCYHSDYGAGVPVVFSSLKENDDYPDPPKENVLIILNGQWRMEKISNKENVHVFYVDHYEPLF